MDNFHLAFTGGADQLFIYGKILKNLVCEGKILLWHKLYIYGTVYNAADIITVSLESLYKFNPEKIIIVDNYSNDGTWELINKVDKVICVQYKCSRGLGRDIALKMALEIAGGNDFLMYADFDVIYKQPMLDLISRAESLMKKNEIYLRLMLSFASTNLDLDWRNLNYGEDWERIARAKSKGICVFTLSEELENDVLGMNGLDNKFFSNRPDNKNILDREERYTTNSIKLVYRIFMEMCNYQRSISFKSFSDYLNHLNYKHYGRRYVIILFFAYVSGRIKGCYSYDKKLNNLDYIDFKHLPRR